MRPSAYATPGSIGPVKSVGGGRREERKGKEIWDEGEVSEQQQFEYEDPRPQPEYVSVAEPFIPWCYKHLCGHKNHMTTLLCPISRCGQV